MKKLKKALANLFRKFLQIMGKFFFRKLEIETFKRVEDALSSEDLAVIALGAGFPGAKPEGWQALWVQRSTNSAKSLFLNRPLLQESETWGLSVDEYEKRTARYHEWCDLEIELLEHVDEQCVYEKEYFRSLFKLNPSELNFGASYIVTLLPRYMKNQSLDQSIKRLTGLAWELRDDLLSHESMGTALKKLGEKALITFRNPSSIEKTKTLINDTSAWDWPAEWGECPFAQPTLYSLHQRKDSLEDTINEISKFSGILKLAVPIHNFKELQLGHQWQQQRPQSRIFLPSSSTGRWNWYRLLTAKDNPFSFLREGIGSSSDQPTLLQVLRHNPKLKRFGAVLGSPINHSLTPATHREFFRTHFANTLGVDVKEQEWSEATTFLQELGLFAAAVTSPLKRKAYESIANKKEQEFHSTNTLLFKNNNIIGSNTDIHGFDTHVTGYKKVEVAVWGGGGTLPIIKKILPHAIFYSSQTGEPRGEESCIDPEVIVWAVGRRSYDERGQLPPKSWNPDIVIDLNYTQDSPGLICAHQYGCQYHSGFDMFLIQAQAQQEFWQKNLQTHPEVQVEM